MEILGYIKMIIRKFGGSSMIQLDSVANILDREAQQGDVTVVSAFKGVTDLLIQCAKRAYYSVDYSKQLEEIRNIHQGIIDSNKLDYSCIQEQITGKETRIATQFQWWKFGESTRTARAATKEAIVKLQEQLKAQSWKLSDLLNADKLATREQMVQYSKPERQKKKRYSQKTKDYQKRTDRKAS